MARGLLEVVESNVVEGLLLRVINFATKNLGVKKFGGVICGFKQLHCVWCFVNKNGQRHWKVPSRPGNIMNSQRTPRNICRQWPYSMRNLSSRNGQAFTRTGSGREKTVLSHKLWPRTSPECPRAQIHQWQASKTRRLPWPAEPVDVGCVLVTKATYYVDGMNSRAG